MIIPFSITNTSELGFNGEVQFLLGDTSLVRNYYIPYGEAISDRLYYNLAEGIEWPPAQLLIRRKDSRLTSVLASFNNRVVVCMPDGA